MSVDNHRDLHVVGLAIHAALATLHAIGVGYNLRRRQPWQATIHALAATYDLWAMTEHRRELAE